MGPRPVPHDEAGPRAHGAVPTAHAHATLLLAYPAAHPCHSHPHLHPTPTQVATGTGIAPYRSFIRRLFVEKTPYGEVYKGLAWLFLGVANSDALLYDDEWQSVLKEYPDNFRVDYALSREQTNVDGGKMYIQDKVKEYSDEVFERMDNGAHMYFCGLKGMMPGITEMLEGVSAKKGINWEDKLKEWKEKGQWHVEVY